MTFANHTIKTVRHTQTPFSTTTERGGVRAKAIGLQAQWIQENGQLICRWTGIRPLS